MPVFSTDRLCTKVSESFAATTVKNLKNSVPTVIRNSLVNTVAKNTPSESARKQKLTADVPIAKETMTQIQLNS